MLARAPPQPLAASILAVGYLQIQASPFVQLEVDADPMAPYMALPAAHVPSVISIYNAWNVRCSLIWLLLFVSILVVIWFTLTSISFPITKKKKDCRAILRRCGNAWPVSLTARALDALLV